MRVRVRVRVRVGVRVGVRVSRLRMMVHAAPPSAAVASAAVSSC